MVNRLTHEARAADTLEQELVIEDTPVMMSDLFRPTIPVQRFNNINLSKAQML